MDYDIDLKMPDACKKCGYKCCHNYYLTCNLDDKGFCKRDRFPICKSYPVTFNEKFRIAKCPGYEYIPKVLFKLIEQLNENIDSLLEFHYEDKDLSLHIHLQTFKAVATKENYEHAGT